MKLAVKPLSIVHNHYMGFDRNAQGQSAVRRGLYVGLCSDVCLQVASLGFKKGFKITIFSQAIGFVAKS